MHFTLPYVTEGHALSVSDSPHVAPGQLHIYPWEIFPDMVVLDWYIRLKDKDRLVYGHLHHHYPPHHQDGWL